MNVQMTDFDFNWWVATYEDLFEDYMGMPKECRETVEKIVTEMFKRGFNTEKEEWKDEK